MAQIGTLGDVVFEVSAELIRTIDDYSRKTAARLTTHDIIGQKPILEFLGPGIDEISFTIRLNVFYGVNPKEEAARLRLICQTGEYVNFVINGSPVSENKWLIESMDEKAKAFDGRGNIITSDLGISLKEYVENGLGGSANAGS